MAKQYVHVRLRREDFEKIIRTKKEPIQQDLSNLMGKKIKLKNIDLFRIAANSVWDLGTNFQSKIVGIVKVKKRNFN